MKLSQEFDIELVVSSDKISFQDLEKLNIGLKIINRGNKEACFDISDTSLFINDEKSYSWDLAVQNGTIINFQVSANSSKAVWWPLGKALFAKPGKYSLDFHTIRGIRNYEIVVT